VKLLINFGFGGDTFESAADKIIELASDANCDTEDLKEIVIALAKLLKVRRR
jgi:hypothetical protein